MRVCLHGLIVVVVVSAGTCFGAQPAADARDLAREVDAYVASETGSSWHGFAGLYVWLPWVDASISFDDGGSGEPPEGDTDGGFEFQWAITGHVEYGTGRWMFFFDGLYVQYGADGSALGNAARFDLEAWIAELGAAWRVFPGDAAAEGERWDVELLGGARVADLTLTTRVPSLDIDNSRGVDWVDPFVGFRVHYALDDDRAWQLQLRADIGGFGAGSELTWNVIVGAGWQCAERWKLFLGYRFLDIDQEDRGPRGALPIHLRLQGPWVAVAFVF